MMAKKTKKDLFLMEFFKLNTFFLFLSLLFHLGFFFGKKMAGNSLFFFSNQGGGGLFFGILTTGLLL